MTKLVWDQIGERLYETGVDHGVLFMPNPDTAEYDSGVAWNGLVTVTESPSGAEASPQYADNIKYLNLYSKEEFGATIEAFTYPKEFSQFDGKATPTPGVSVGQQSRRGFGLAYRSQIGNDIDGADHGYKIHLVYACMASPSEKAYGTQNDSPEPITFSWELTTTPVPVEGYPDLKPTAIIEISSLEVDPDDLAALEQILYGDVGVDPRLPMPGEVLALFEGSVVSGAPVEPAYNAATDIITIPATTGVEYMVDGNVVPAGDFGPITEDTMVTARPAAGYVFPAGVDDDWLVTFS